MKMTYKPKLAVAPFGRRDSRHMLISREGALWLSLASEGAPSMIPTAPRPAGLFEISVLTKGVPTPYTYSATESVLEIKAPGGAARITHDCAMRALRVEAEGISLRFDGKMAAGVSSLNTADGTVVNIGGGRYVFAAKRGKLTFDDSWMLASFGSVTPVADIEPAGGIIELTIYEIPGDTALPASAKTFEQCAADNSAEYSAFAKKIVRLPEKFSKLRGDVTYSLWLNSKKLENGRYCIGTDRLTSTAASAYGQAIASLAFRDFDTAFELLTSLPEASPPLHGFAVMRMIDDGLLDGAPIAKLRELYFALEKTAKWWRENRTLPGAALSYYAYRFETGHWNPASFTAGAPVLAPDLNAYLVLLYEALSQFAANFGDAETSDKYAASAKARLDAMLNTLWDGERFFAVNVYSGKREIPKLSKPESSRYAPLGQSETPIILGERLPKPVLAKLVETVIETGAPETSPRSGPDLEYPLRITALAAAGERKKAKALALGEIERVTAENVVTDPIYGAALLALAAKAI
jgi:hypothetical protein